MESTWQISRSSHTWRLENLRPANFSLYSKMRLIFQTLIVVFQTEDELLQFRRFVRGIISPRVTFWVCFLCYFLVAGLRSSALPCTIRCYQTCSCCFQFWFWLWSQGWGESFEYSQEKCMPSRLMREKPFLTFLFDFISKLL